MLITAEQFQNTETNRSIVERKMKSPYAGTPMETFHSLSSKAKGFFEQLAKSWNRLAMMSPKEAVIMID